MKDNYKRCFHERINPKVLSVFVLVKPNFFFENFAKWNSSSVFHLLHKEGNNFPVKTAKPLLLPK